MNVLLGLIAIVAAGGVVLGFMGSPSNAIQQGIYDLRTGFSGVILVICLVGMSALNKLATIAKEAEYCRKELERLLALKRGDKV